MNRHRATSWQASWTAIDWWGMKSQTMSLPFHQSVEQAENWRCGQWLYLNDRFNLVPVCSGKAFKWYDSLTIPYCCREQHYTQYIVVQRREILLYIVFWIWPYKMQGIKNGTNNVHNSRVNREGIVECTKNGKAGRQGEEKEKFPTPTKPVQSPAPLLLPDSPSFLPLFTQEGRKWGKHPGISAQLRELRAQEEGVK